MKDYTDWKQLHRPLMLVSTGNLQLRPGISCFLDLNVGNGDLSGRGIGICIMLQDNQSEEDSSIQIEMDDALPLSLIPKVSFSLQLPTKGDGDILSTYAVVLADALNDSAQVNAYHDQEDEVIRIDLTIGQFTTTGYLTLTDAEPFFK